MNARVTVHHRTGAALKRGRSKQDYQTPSEFLEAVVRRFGPIAWDLAAHAQNTAAGDRYYGPGSKHGENSLEQDWSKHAGLLWLNPPFADIAPWAAKCASVRDRRDWLTMLVPASIGTNWFAEHALDKGLTLGLSPRITFVGETIGYPKDLALIVYGFGLRGFDCWRWDQ